MPMYNLLEYSQNYSWMTSGSLWNYYRDEIDDVDDNASNGKSLKYKTRIVGKTPQRPAQPDKDQDGNQEPQPPVPALNLKSLFYTNIVVIFGDFLI